MRGKVAGERHPGTQCLHSAHQLTQRTRGTGCTSETGQFPKLGMWKMD